MTKVFAVLRRVSSFLTPEGRRAVYIFLGMLGAAATAMGWLTQTQVSSVVVQIGHVLDFLALVLAAAHVTPDTAPQGDAGTPSSGAGTSPTS